MCIIALKFNDNAIFYLNMNEIRIWEYSVCDIFTNDNMEKIINFYLLIRSINPQFKQFLHYSTVRFGGSPNLSRTVTLKLPALNRLN